MVAIVCQHEDFKKHGRDRKGNQRYRCLKCGKRWADEQPKLLGDMRIPLEDAKLALRLLTEGMSLRATERTTGLHRGTICRIMVLLGEGCRKLLHKRMRNLTLSHLQFDEQWTCVPKKQSRLTLHERERSHDKGDMYLWTCIDQETKLMPAFVVGKRCADNARRFLSDVAGRLNMPKPGSHGISQWEERTICTSHAERLDGT